MATAHIFISHANKDDDFVKELRTALESLQLPVWVDSRSLRGGAKLTPEIEQAIETARQVVVILSPNTVNSPWVHREIQKSLEVEKQRKDEGYRVIPLLLPGVGESALGLWFGDKPGDIPVAVKIQLQAGGLGEALPAILTALGERSPDDSQTIVTVPEKPVEELTLKLTDTRIEHIDGKQRAKASAQLIYQPADHTSRAIESKRYLFEAPLGPIEADDLRWYLEQYYLWPTGVFTERAQRVEANLPRWGQELYRAASATDSAKDALTAWLNTASAAERRFSILVDSDLPDGSGQEDQVAANEAASVMLSLPWELLHDGHGYLFHGKNPARVRRRLPNRRFQPAVKFKLPIRILIVSPRPEDKDITYIDHRVSARPLVEAIESLGALVDLTILTPPTFLALQEALHRAAEAMEPFDVVHFDGHGDYDNELGIGGLYFEDAKDSHKLEYRAPKLISAQEIGQVIRDHRIPLVFLEACQSAKTEMNPTASVAAKLLEEGVISVVAMSHSVLVETARRFVAAFYQELVRGARVGTAMLAGQRALVGDTYRGKIWGAGELHLQDWFVPVLYQEEQDPRLITQQPPQAVRELQTKQRRLSLGNLPDPPPHHFQGRSRELLAIERLLHNQPHDQLHHQAHAQPYAVVRGQGGAGKTTLAAELARWLVRTNCFRRAAFVSLEQYTDARAMLDSLGRQLLPQGDNWSVAHFGDDLKEALQPIKRALRDQSTILVLDNLESVLPNASAGSSSESADEILAICRELLDSHPATRLVFTSREPLPAPFDHKFCDRLLGALDHVDAIELVGQVLAQEGLIPRADDPGDTSKEVKELVEAVNCHARALVLLAHEVARHGVRATTVNLHYLIEELDRKHPGDRENSLYASVELSLRRLPMEVREQIKVLSMFHGVANLAVLEMMLEAEERTIRNLARALIEVGLVEDIGRGHLRLDPALPAFLLRELSETEQEVMRSRWAEEMQRFTSLMALERDKNAELSACLTLLELPNLIALLEWMQEHASAEEVFGLAFVLEEMFFPLGRPQILARAKRIREQTAHSITEKGKGDEWSLVRYMSENANIDRLLDSGELQAAFAAARQLLELTLAAEKAGYPVPKDIIADANFKLGKVLVIVGAAEAALTPLTEAQLSYQGLVDEGNTMLAWMVSSAISEKAGCLLALGRLDSAAAAYQEAIMRDEKLDNQRGVTVNRFQLGTVRLRQGRYTEALNFYAEAKNGFERLSMPSDVANVWHQIGRVYGEVGQLEQAEHSLVQALRIRVQHKLIADEATTLSALGYMYDLMGRLEEAVKCCRQAADTFIKLHDQYKEGFARNNLANTLIKLECYDEARHELRRALECLRQYGHAAQLWTPWDNLRKVEQATGHPQAAAEARQQGSQCYLAYLRDGAQSREWAAQACADVAGTLQSGSAKEVAILTGQLSAALADPDISARSQALFPKLQAILGGDRDIALANDPALDCVSAVELKLLLEALNK